MLFFLLTNVGILTFMSRKNFILNQVEHEKSFITSGLDCRDQRDHDVSHRMFWTVDAERSFALRQFISERLPPINKVFIYLQQVLA